MKNKLYFLTLAVGIVLIVSAFVFKNNKGSDVADMESDNKQKEISADNKNVIAGNSIEGVLRPSDNTNRGNWKLVSSVGDIYIRTIRDYSNLIGLQVLVTINGTFDNFELINIETKIEKDGFLLSQ